MLLDFAQLEFCQPAGFTFCFISELAVSTHILLISIGWRQSFEKLILCLIVLEVRIGEGRLDFVRTAFAGFGRG